MEKLPDYDQLGVDDLLAALAAELYGEDLHNLGPADIRRRIEDARQWAQGWLSRNREALCSALTRRGLRNSDNIDGIVDFATLVDLIAGFELGQPTAAIIAALVIKWGIPAICGKLPAGIED